ncbi:GNAT family N-acetyltransferase [Butyrivibrio sp. YAB3001]|uniref:GNAT family N-acetyltransferase n=1 Tax=Butyrivibrio sp. YAB3001 TaxID=1520812 RepID=UPI0008F62236|nr:GNAT family protein [Butyrivibrio sp. YAB3001]SFC16681.1 Protein N-acetyltransferase, RimJ/RimL family [Butyrivibrio sp. YAB3001]
MAEKMIKTGEKVSFRMITNEDTEAVVRWRNNERVRQNFVYREHFTPEIHENWLKTEVETGEVLQMIICENAKDLRPVGSVYLRFTDDSKKTAEYGIFIGEDDAIGMGYGSETARLAVEYAKEELGMDKLFLRVFSYNTIAIKSYENAGFVRTKELKDVECSDGKISDMILMENCLK